ncbi:hypothetical protein QJ854_gp271 [Moumouvirus goulette]|uniref:Uncharacterized protein n=1 Tax=Moumouvirus goulette TaxID=1247379 RepID=M1PNE0_9VIRU|nr:hypothetical protein QJ854_gp271 [Moumouvirus goulette]AGF85511.1 hypothetical protein glt_00706 [Moumouvirus goulette]
MKLFKGLNKLIRGLKIKNNPKFLIIYGNYGGAGYSACCTLITKENKLYKFNNDEFIYQQEMTVQDYYNYYLKLFQDVDVVDELDACFKLHDLDTNTNNLRDIIKASHALPINMGKIDPIFYLGYPTIFLLGVIYFYIFKKIGNYLDEDELLNIYEYRLQCQNEYTNKYGIKYI